MGGITSSLELAWENHKRVHCFCTWPFSLSPHVHIAVLSRPCLWISNPLTPQPGRAMQAGDEIGRRFFPPLSIVAYILPMFM